MELRLLLVIALGVGLAACAQTPRATGGAPPGISFRLQGEPIAQVDQRADQYCQRYGKHAQRTSVEHQGDTAIAVYECS